jgi:hypothetical protein
LVDLSRLFGQVVDEIVGDLVQKSGTEARMEEIAFVQSMPFTTGFQDLLDLRGNLKEFGKWLVYIIVIPQKTSFVEPERTVKETFLDSTENRILLFSFWRDDDHAITGTRRAEGGGVTTDNAVFVT